MLFLLGGTCPFWTEVALSLCYWFRLDTVNRCKLLKEVEEALWKAWTKESLFLDDGKWWLQEAWNFSGSTRRDCSDRLLSNNSCAHQSLSTTQAQPSNVLYMMINDAAEYVSLGGVTYIIYIYICCLYYIYIYIIRLCKYIDYIDCT